VLFFFVNFVVSCVYVCLLAFSLLFVLTEQTNNKEKVSRQTYTQETTKLTKKNSFIEDPANLVLRLLCAQSFTIQLLGLVDLLATSSLVLTQEGQIGAVVCNIMPSHMT
jgi:hypothetical protein